MTSLTLRDAATVVAFEGDVPVRGHGFARVRTHENVSVTFDGGRVVAVGDDGGAGRTFDASGCTVLPGFVDPHTHVPFYGWRADEDAARLTGVRYETIHGREGGIFRSARMLAEATDEEILSFARSRATAMLRQGTTTFETKSGYGLTVEAELRQLRLARRLASEVPQHVVPTCLAAHAIPRGMTQGEWIGIASDELLPRAVEEGLVEAVDLYIETIAFALEHAARLAHAAEALGLRKRVHADQLADNQTASFAARWGFATADHLNHASPEGVEDLAASDTVAVLLPGATFTLRQDKKPPARALLDSGAVVALGSDLNPGTSPISSMLLVMALACRLYGFSPVEAIAAATVNAAYALGAHEEVGRLVPGMRGDAVVLDMPNLDHLAYRPDADAVLAVVCEGQLVHVAERASERLT